MIMKMTENALVAQMVRDAIVNDPSGEGGGGLPRRVHARARIWYDRAIALKSKNCFYYSSVVDKTFEEFLCEQERNLGILDFWDGDIVDDVSMDRGGNEKVRTGVVKSIKVNATINGGGRAKVLFQDGGESSIAWQHLRHSKIPQVLVDLAKTQLMATHACPLMAHSGNDKEDQNG